MSHRSLLSIHLSLALFLAAPLSASAQPASRPACRHPGYEPRLVHDPDGTGTFYMGREIAQVMGHEAADWLDRPEREQEEHTGELLKLLQVKPGDVIADVGAGSGYYSLRLARLVGPSGRVKAVDIQQEMLDLIGRRRDQAHLQNIDLVLGANDNPRLAPNSVDLVLLVDVYHEFDRPYEMMTQIVRATRPGGRIVLVEFRKEDPNVPIKLVHKMTEAQVLREMAIHGVKHLETLRSLPWQHVIVFEKPAVPWLGVHVGINNDPEAAALMAELPRLAGMGINTLVMEVNYSFEFRSHPELHGDRFLSRRQARLLAEACRAQGIRPIPQLNCLGHQSWSKHTGPLLTKYPEFDETPGQFPENKNIYCRSWCPLHPGVNKVIFELMDELIDGFQADAFHVGMDEVFLIASEYCSRCRGKDPADLFAQAVNDYHRHLVDERHVEMLMWADRLLDARATGYGEWEADKVGTHPAIDRIPRDIVMCDWHYEKRDRYPSLPFFLDKGFKVWPSGWHKVEAATAFADDALRHRNPRMLGYLCTTWGKVRPGALAEFPCAPGYNQEMAANPLNDYPPASLPAFDAVPTREGYDRWAEIYDGEDNPLVLLEEPRVIDLLGNVRGLNVADIGCGTGRHALRLAGAGAQVTALDFSREMMSRATQKPGAAAIRWMTHDLVEPLPFTDRQFDRVLCCLVADHIPDLARLFAELGRICRPEGFIIVSTVHPAMLLRGIQARFTDPATGRETRPASCAHQMADYVMAVANARLQISHFSEHAVDQDLAARSPRAEKYLGWPILLLMRLQHPSL